MIEKPSTGKVEPLDWKIGLLAGWMVLASVITGMLYAIDKRSAMDRTGTRPKRISERKLLFWSMLGGWPGAIIVGRRIRHKTQKLSYRLLFSVCVALHVTACFILLASI